MGVNIKILGHIIGFASVITGGILVHQAYNARQYNWEYLEFFNLKINTATVFDIGLCLMGTGYLIECWRSLKSLEYKKKSDAEIEEGKKQE